ncbi:MAG: DUF4394 domain-containing protein [Ignavibacteria bacterium]|nr:DUF4394 domain-containing protein [Ignavibacteria bacterium]
MRLFLTSLLVLMVLFSFGAIAQDQPSTGLAPYIDAPSKNIIPNPVSTDYWNSRAFGYKAYPTPTFWFSMFLNNPGTLTQIGSDAGNFVTAASFAPPGMTLYAVRYGILTLYTVDTTTGNFSAGIPITGVSGNITGMAYDWSTSTMFIVSYSTASQLYSLNLTTGAATAIGSPQTGLVIDIGCSSGGNLYGVEISNDNLVSINKTTGVLTVIGPIGFNANYAQGMSWDHSTDSCFYASYNATSSSGELRRVNLQTGATTLIGAFASSAEVDGFAIPGAPGPQIVHTPLANTTNLNGPYPVNAVITTVGSTITSAKVFWSRNNPNITDSVNMTNTGGNNWTANIPGNGTVATYRYYIWCIDGNGKIGKSPSNAPASLHQFIAAPDTGKPVITHTPLPNWPRLQWPATVTAVVTDAYGVDSVWVGWRKFWNGQYKRFNLAKGTGDNWSGVFNSDTSQVAVGDTIYYRVIARDFSNNRDSTPLYNFRIINQVTVCIGTGTTLVGYPFYTFYMDSKTHMLYLGSEIGVPSGGSITRIGFNVGAIGSPAMSGFQVRMQNTTITTITGFVTTGTWQTVFTSNSYLPTGTGWQYIDLSTPFSYNGTNLLVEVCFNNSSWSANTTVNATAVSPQRTFHQYADLSTGNGCVDPLSLTTSNPLLPNVCLVINPGGSGISNFNNEIPVRYELGQNYPNPFNPITKINFSIPKQGLVTLKVYDVLGREVATLVNEVKTPGNYMVDFDASELASGVYFYKLDVNGFSDVKRMMLIK